MIYLVVMIKRFYCSSIVDFMLQFIVLFCIKSAQLCEIDILTFDIFARIETALEVLLHYSTL